MTAMPAISYGAGVYVHKTGPDGTSVVYHDRRETVWLDECRGVSAADFAASMKAAGYRLVNVERYTLTRGDYVEDTYAKAV